MGGPSTAFGLFDHRTYLPNVPVTVKTRRIFSPDAEGKMKPVVSERKQSFHGTLLGHDQWGRAIVQLDDGVSTTRVKFKALAPDLPAHTSALALRAQAADPELIFQGIAPELREAAPERLKVALDRALDRPAVGTHSAREFIDALQARGHRVLLVGGAIRDVVHALAVQPDISDEELVTLLADVDLSTTALPSEVRELTAQIAPELGESAIWSGPFVDKWGTVGLGARKDGVDVAAMKVGFSDRSGSVLGHRLIDDALGRDFTGNQVYLDLATHQLVDPSGNGLADARARLLRPNPYHPELNEMLALRWLKFRARGFQPAPGSLPVIQAHAAAGFPRMSETPDAFRVANNFLRIAPAEAHSPEGLDAHLAKLQAVADEDGLGELFATHVLAHRDAILALAHERDAAAAP